MVKLIRKLSDLSIKLIKPLKRLKKKHKFKTTKDNVYLW